MALAMPEGRQPTTPGLVQSGEAGWVDHLADGLAGFLIDEVHAVRCGFVSTLRGTGEPPGSPERRAPADDSHAVAARPGAHPN